MFSNTHSYSPTFKQECGEIHGIFGCMFSNKSSTLTQYAERYQRAKKNVLMINFAGNKRYGFEAHESINNHNSKTNGNKSGEMFNILALSHLKGQLNIEEETKDVCKAKYNWISKEDFDKVDMLFIEEGHFFNDIEIVHEISKLGKDIYVASLDLDRDGKMWPNYIKLYKLCDTREMRDAVCEEEGCSSQHATFTYYKKEGINSSLINIGDEDYMPMCRSCFLKRKNLF